MSFKISSVKERPRWRRLLAVDRYEVEVELDDGTRIKMTAFVGSHPMGLVWDVQRKLRKLEPKKLMINALKQFEGKTYKIKGDC